MGKKDKNFLTVLLMVLVIVSSLIFLTIKFTTKKGVTSKQKEKIAFDVENAMGSLPSIQTADIPAVYAPPVTKENLLPQKTRNKAGRPRKSRGQIKPKSTKKTSCLSNRAGEKRVFFFFFFFLFFF